MISKNFNEINTSKKPTILFVGSFKTVTKNGSVGGQMFACNTIINSDLSKRLNWILLDTTSFSNIKSSFVVRLIKAIIRIILFFYYTLFYKIDKYLIFVGDSWSIWEKGSMILIAKLFTTRETIIAPRSGFIENDINNNKLLKKFIVIVFKNADKVVCQSKKWKDEFIRLTKSEEHKFIIIENAITLEPYINFPIQRKENKDTNIILYLSWVDKNKGIFDLLDAILLLKNENFKFKLIVAGNGSAFNDAKQFVLKNNLSDSVHFFGWAYGDEKYQLLKKSDIFVLPTHFEGYPNSLLEAMVSGKACVATSVGSIPDMIDNQKSGLLINKKSPIEIYEALKLLICDNQLRLSLAHESRKIASTRNSLESFVKKISELLTH